MPDTRDVYFDQNMTNFLIEKAETEQEWVADSLFPTVPVNKRSGNMFAVDTDDWHQAYDDLRADGDVPNEIEWQTTTDTYYCFNRTLREKIPYEADVQADVPLREQGAINVYEALMRAKEIRVSARVLANVGSGALQTGANAWSATNSADIKTQMSTAHQYYVDNGLPAPNVAVIDWVSYDQATRNELLLNYFKYTKAGATVRDDDLKVIFRVNSLYVSRAVYNTNQQGGTVAKSLIWGRNLILAHVANQPRSTRVRSYGLTMAWRANRRMVGNRPMYVARYNVPDPGANAYYQEAGFYHDEKVVAAALAYKINTLSGY